MTTEIKSPINVCLEFQPFTVDTSFATAVIVETGASDPKRLTDQLNGPALSQVVYQRISLNSSDIKRAVAFLVSVSRFPVL